MKRATGAEGPVVSPQIMPTPMAKLAHVEGEEFFRVFDLVRAGRLGSVVSESLPAVSEVLYLEGNGAINVVSTCDDRWLAQPA